MLAALQRLLGRFPLREELLSPLDGQERRLIVRSVIIGIVVWGLVFTLRQAVETAFHASMNAVERSPSVFLVLVPLLLGSVVMAAFAKYRTHRIAYRDDQGTLHDLNDVEGDGLERAIALYYTSEPALEQALLGREGVEVRWTLPTMSLALRKWLTTLVTLGSGGSGGLEASVTLIGESSAAGLLKPRRTDKMGVLSGFWRWWRSTDPDELQTAQLGGISAAVATLLGAPFAAAFLATEVMYRRRPLISKLVYSLIPALVAYFLTNVYGGHEPMVVLPRYSTPPASPEYYGLIVVMAFLIALAAKVFTKLRYASSALFARFHNVWLRHAVGATITGAVAISVVFWSGRELSLVLGTGEAGIQAAVDGTLAWQLACVLLIAKIVATLATISSGGSAGLLIPSVFLGTMIAAALADAIGADPVSFVAPAITASLVSIVNIPLAAILFAVEMFGTAYMVPALIALVAASIFSDRVSIYRTQREHFDRREILPGFSIRRVVVPVGWEGETLASLDVRKRFGLTVIGVIEHTEGDDQRMKSQMRLDPGPAVPLCSGAILVVMGSDALLETFRAALAEESPASLRNENSRPA